MLFPSLSCVLTRFKTIRNASVVALSFSLITASPLQAASRQSHQSVRQAITDYVHDIDYRSPYPIDVNVGHIDKRLRLSQCEVPLNVFFSSSQKRMGNTALGVRCTQAAKPWTIYVKTKIYVYDDVVSLQRPIARQQVIEAADVQTRKEELSRLLSGYYTQVEDVIGMQAKRPLRQGAILKPRSLTPRLLVNRGEIVTLVSNTRGIKVHMQGKAMGDGYKGKHVRVKNSSSGRIISGTVISDGVVKVGF